MKKLLLIITLSFVFGPLFCSAQTPTYFVIKYPTNLTLVSLRRPIVKILQGENFGKPENYETEQISITQKDSIITKILKVNIKDTTCIFFNDFPGRHEMIVTPGDTIRLKVENIDLNALKKGIGPKLKTPWTGKISYEGKNRFINGLCDSLFIAYGVLAGNMGIKEVHFRDTSVQGLPDFCNQVKEIYTERMNYLNNYCSKYAIPKKVWQLAESEIYYAYISNLLNPMFVLSKIDIDQYPESYRQDLKKFRTNDNDMYFKTSLKSSTLYFYIYINNSSKATPVHSLISTYNAIKNNYSNPIRDHLQVINLDYIIRAKGTSVNPLDSLIRDFKSNCKDANYNRYVDSLYVWKQKEDKTTQSYDEAIKSMILDQNNKQQTLSSLLKNESIIIDCWASWCNPCLKEIGIGKQYEKTYGDKVKFIYLSFDRDKNKWLKKSNELELTNSYLLENNFKSILARHYGIYSIPHYLIFNRKKKSLKLINIRPSDGNDYKEMLNDLAKTDN